MYKFIVNFKIEIFFLNAETVHTEMNSRQNVLDHIVLRKHLRRYPISFIDYYIVIVFGTICFEIEL